jgi:hypothetical protein
LSRVLDTRFIALFWYEKYATSGLPTGFTSEKYYPFSLPKGEKQKLREI